MCRLIATALEMENFSVDWVASAVKALDVLHKRQYAVVVSDLKMTPMDGVTFLSEARRKFP